MGSCICDPSLAVGSVLTWMMKVKRLTLINLIGLGQFNTLTAISFVVFVGRSKYKNHKTQDFQFPAPGTWLDLRL